MPKLKVRLPGIVRASIRLQQPEKTDDKNIKRANGRQRHRQYYEKIKHDQNKY